MPTAANGPYMKDIVALTKPSITVSNVLMAAVGLLAARVAPTTPTALATLAGVALVVASANTFNMVLERASDRLMERTRERPLAAGRVAPWVGWLVAIFTGASGVLVLALATNLVATSIGAGAVLIYAFVYTPLKRRTAHALTVGALAGATPPLIGALAASSTELDVGLALAGVVFLWQFPHFLAIAARRQRDYAAAGIAAASVVWGLPTTHTLARWTALGLVPLGLVPTLGGALSPWTGAAIAVLGALVWAASLRQAWVRPTFLASLFYLPGLCFAVVLDRLIT